MRAGFPADIDVKTLSLRAAPAARIALLLLAAAALTACGQKGDLVRPTPQSAVAVQADAAPSASEHASP